MFIWLRKIALLCLILFMFCDAGAQQGKDLVAMADKAYEAKQEDKARKLYEQAAAQGNSDAHFALAYKYEAT